MEIIDFNVHITKNGIWFGNDKNCTVDQLINLMNVNGIDKSVIMPLSVNISNEFVASVCSEYPDKLYGFGTISVKGCEQDVEFIKSNNLVGCKFHPRIQGISIFDLHTNGILDILEKEKVPLAICCWPQVHNNNLTNNDVSPFAVEELAKKYPKLVFIILHMGGHKLWDSIFISRANNNIYLDCSYFIDFFKGTSLESDFWEVINKIDEKIIYGSDYPEIDIGSNYRYVKKMAKEKMNNPQKLFYNNAMKIICGSL